MTMVLVKRLYDEAGALYTQARGVMDGFKDQEMPAEKAKEVDDLLDQVEKKTGEAKRLERSLAMDRVFNQAADRPAMFGAEDGAKDEAGNATLLMKAAANAYLRKGFSGLKEEERKSLFVGEDTAGGYLVQDTYRYELLDVQKKTSVMREICEVLPPVPSGSVITPTADDSMTDATWTTELLTGTEDTAKPFGQRKLTPHPLAKRIKVSNTFLRNPNFDADAWLRRHLAESFNRAEENAFINGTGAQQPLGILNTVGLPTYTTVTANAIYGDDVINWIYSLPATYARNASILSNRAFIRKIRLMRKPDAAGTFDNYIWQPSFHAGLPGFIVDVPYYSSDYFDDGLTADAWDNNAPAAVVGDFKKYWIVDAMNLSIQRLVELYAETNQTGYIGRKEVDGMAVLAEAFYLLKVKSA